MSWRVFTVSLLGAAIICGSAGCGGASVATGGKPVAVSGTVMLEGVPLEGATVSFSPDGEGGQPAKGLSGSGGAFRLTTRNSNDGAVPGAYLVTVIKADAVGGAGGGAIDPKSPEYAKMMGSMTKSPKSGGPHKDDAHGIHANYRDPKKTPLKFTIGSSGDKNIKIELSKSGT